MIKVGPKLKESRQSKRLSIEDVSSATKIRPSFLIAIEKGEYEKLPSVAYASGFVKNYARFLGLPENEILALFRREFDEEKVFKVLPEGLAKQDVSISRFKSKGTFLLIGLAVVVFFGYILFQYRGAFISPSLKIETPKENQVFESSRVAVIGRTDPDSTVYVNEFPVSVDINGSFKKTIVVFPGKSTINIKAINRFGRESLVRKTVEVKNP